MLHFRGPGLASHIEVTHLVWPEGAGTVHCPSVQRSAVDCWLAAQAASGASALALSTPSFLLRLRPRPVAARLRISLHVLSRALFGGEGAAVKTPDRPWGELSPVGALHTAVAALRVGCQGRAGAAEHPRLWEFPPLRVARFLDPPLVLTGCTLLHQACEPPHAPAGPPPPPLRRRRRRVTGPLTPPPPVAAAAE